LKAKACGLFSKSDLLDHDGSVEQLRDRCQGVIASMLQVPDLHSVASASWARFAQMRPVVRALLQATITLEAPRLTRADVTPGCQETGGTDVHTRTVSSEIV
jgi:hypothetical protein